MYSLFCRLGSWCRLGPKSFAAIQYVCFLLRRSQGLYLAPAYAHRSVGSIALAHVWSTCVACELVGHRYSVGSVNRRSPCDIMEAISGWIVGTNLFLIGSRKLNHYGYILAYWREGRAEINRRRDRKRLWCEVCTIFVYFCGRSIKTDLYSSRLLKIIFHPLRHCLGYNIAHVINKHFLKI